MIKQELLNSGIDMNIIPIVAFRNKIDISEVKTNYPVMHTVDVIRFINQNKLPINIIPEQIAAALER